MLARGRRRQEPSQPLVRPVEDLLEKAHGGGKHILHSQSSTQRPPGPRGALVGMEQVEEGEGEVGEEEEEPVRGEGGGITCDLSPGRSEYL